MYGYYVETKNADVAVITARITLILPERHWRNIPYKAHVIRCICAGIVPLGPRRLQHIFDRYCTDKTVTNFWGDYET